jgi:hypothetical protein
MTLTEMKQLVSNVSGTYNEDKFAALPNNFIAPAGFKIDLNCVFWFIYSVGDDSWASFSEVGIESGDCFGIMYDYHLKCFVVVAINKLSKNYFFMSMDHLAGMQASEW